MNRHQTSRSGGPDMERIPPELAASGRGGSHFFRGFSSKLTARVSEGPVCCSFPFSQSCTARQWLSSCPTLASRAPFSLKA